MSLTGGLSLEHIPFIVSLAAFVMGLVREPMNRTDARAPGNHPIPIVFAIRPWEGTEKFSAFASPPSCGFFLLDQLERGHLSPNHSRCAVFNREKRVLSRIYFAD
jgi:hypothetical protein